jgi:ABC-type multidrug transport system fused ATPase/permease subunit
VKTLEKWADRVYAETDVGRSVATSIAGIIGLVVYIIFRDWVIAAFSSIISFPIVRIVSTSLNEKANRRKERLIKREEAEEIFNRLSKEEKDVVQAFVKAGGSVLTWSQMNNQSVSLSSIESLIQREVLWTSMTADGMRETFALNSAIFDIGNEKLKSNKDS